MANAFGGHALERTETLFDALDALLVSDAGATFLRCPESSRSWSRGDFADAAETLGAALKMLSPRPFFAGLLMSNRPEYMIADMAILLASGVPVSLYPTSSAEQLSNILDNADISIVFVEAAKLDTLLQAAGKKGSIRAIIVIDAVDVDALPGPQYGEVIRYEELTRNGFGRATIADARRRASASDLVTLIYTSGTTGAPKGVRLTHRNFLVAAGGIGGRAGLAANDKIISWLPHAHVAERTCSYATGLLYGLNISLCPDTKRLPDLLREVNPDWFGAFPRLWEKLKLVAEAYLAERSDSSVLAEALAIGLAAAKSRGGRSTSSDLRRTHEEAERTLFAPLRAHLGLSRAKSLITGSAPTPFFVHEFFAAIGLPLGELYGASESCTYGAMDVPGDLRIGSAGTFVPGMDIRIADDGEILLKGDAVMEGYHHAPDQNAAAFTEDGWYRTGDVGHLDEEDRLWISGRKKEVVINASGQNMAPAYIESMIKSGSPLIGQVCMIGEARAFNVALIMLDGEVARAIAGRHGLPGALGALARHPIIEAQVARGVASGNKRLARVEQIKRFTIMPAEWEPGGDELTQTLKLKRDRIAAKYLDLIETLYREAPDERCLLPIATSEAS